MKKTAPEVKYSWSDDVIRSTSSEARSPEAKVHQKMGDLKASKAFQRI